MTEAAVRQDQMIHAYNEEVTRFSRNPALALGVVLYENKLPPNETRHFRWVNLNLYHQMAKDLEKKGFRNNVKLSNRQRENFILVYPETLDHGRYLSVFARWQLGT